MKEKMEYASLLKVDDVARVLRVHPGTVRRWTKKGILKACIINSRGDRRFKQEDVDSFIKGGRNG